MSARPDCGSGFLSSSSCASSSPLVIINHFSNKNQLHVGSIEPEGENSSMSGSCFMEDDCENRSPAAGSNCSHLRPTSNRSPAAAAEGSLWFPRPSLPKSQSTKPNSGGALSRLPHQAPNSLGKSQLAQQQRRSSLPVKSSSSFTPQKAMEGKKLYPQTGAGPFMSPAPAFVVKPSPTGFKSSSVISKKTRHSIGGNGAPSSVTSSLVKANNASSLSHVKPTPQTPSKRPLFSVGLASPIGSETPSKPSNLSAACAAESSTARRVNELRQAAAEPTTPFKGNFSFGSFDQPAPATAQRPSLPHSFTNNLVSTPVTQRRLLSMTLSPSTPLMHSSQYNYLNDTGNTSSAMMGQPAMSGAAPSMVNALKSYHFPEGVRSSSSLLELFQCSSPDRTSAAAAQPFAALNQNPAMDSTINMAAQTSICSDISMGVADDLMDEFDEIRPATQPRLAAPPVSPLVWNTPFVNFLTVEYFQHLANDSNYMPIPPSHIHVFDDYFETHFLILDQIGQGSFADAFKVQSLHHDDHGGEYDGDSEKFYAVKRARNQFIGYKDRLQKLQEVEIILKIGLDSPYCVHLQQAWEQRGHLYIQTDFYENGNLDNYLCHVLFDESMVWQALADLVLGLKHIHDHQVVHLDLKPSNIFVGDDGTLRIGDFGMAIELPVDTNIDREGDRIYIAPEVLRGIYGKPSDMFSLGLVLVEMAGNCDLPDSGEGWHKLRRADISDVPFEEGVSRELVDLIQSLLNPDPGLRPTVDHLLLHPRLAEVVYGRIYNHQ